MTVLPCTLSVVRCLLLLVTTAGVTGLASPRVGAAQHVASAVGARSQPRAPEQVAAAYRISGERLPPSNLAAVQFSPAVEAGMVAGRARGGRRRGSAAPYVLGGATVGALGMVVGLAAYSRHIKTETVMVSPLALAPAVAGSAVLGAGLGYVVYRVVRR